MTIEAGMIFTLGTKEEALEAAKQVEFTGGNFVNIPGGYCGIVETAVFKKFPSGAGGMEIAMKVCDDPENDGKTCKIMIITMKKDGTSTYKNGKGELMLLPGVNQIRGALMPVLRKKELAAVKNGDEFIYPDIVGQKIGMAINIRKSNGKTNGKVDTSKVYENADIKTFFCPKTRLCGSEILNGIIKPERLTKIIDGLIVKDETQVAAPVDAVDPADPFGDSGTPDAGDDPFAAQGEGTVDTSVEDAAAKAIADKAIEDKAIEDDAAAKVITDAAAAEQLAADKAAVTETPAETVTETTETPAATGADEENFWD